MEERIIEHTLTLTGNDLTLRSLTESDWDILLKWNSDPEVLYFSEGDDVSAYSLAEVQGIYREVSQTAFCFMIEYEGQPIGECWLQQMNYQRILEKYPGKDTRRIDLMIGEKSLWGQGLGTRVIGLLTEFAFQSEHADMVFGCGIADYNPRSLRAFEKNGYQVDAVVKEVPGMKASCSYDLAITASRYFQRTA